MVSAPPPWGGWGGRRPLGGGMDIWPQQVIKALHTCTSWYAYAAMFSSSFHILSVDGLMYVQADQPSLPGSLIGRVLWAKTSSLYSTILRQLQLHLRTLL